MRKWSEYHYWHWFVRYPVLWTISSLAIIVSMRMSSQDNHWAMNLLGMVLLLAGGIGGFLGTIWLANDGRRAFNADYNLRWQLLAVVEKGTTKVVACSLDKARLKPWPFNTKYEVRSYPAYFSFDGTLQPITRNPKVIPLRTVVGVTLASHNDIPEWFPNYLFNQANSARNEFGKHTFGLLLHRLPQDLGEKLNPYDHESIEGLKEFVSQELGNNLPFKHDVQTVTISLK